MVERESSHAGRVLSRTRPVAGSESCATQPCGHVSRSRMDKYLSELDYAGRRLSSLVQLRLGSGAYAEQNHAPAVLAFGKIFAGGIEIRNDPQSSATRGW